MKHNYYLHLLASDIDYIKIGKDFTDKNYPLEEGYIYTDGLLHQIGVAVEHKTSDLDELIGDCKRIQSEISNYKLK